MVVILILGGIQMLMLGVLGEYLWRALDEGRRRPRYLIETTIGRPGRQDRVRPAKIVETGNMAQAATHGNDVPDGLINGTGHGWGRDRAEL